MTLLVLYSTLYYFLIIPAIAASIWFLLKTPESKGRNTLVLGLVLLVPLIVRLPYILLNSELNVDESGIIGQAIGLKNGLLVWRDMNLSTAGPVNTYAYFIFCSILNIPFDFTSARLLGLFLDSLTLLLLFKAGQKQFGFNKSIMALIVVMVLWNFRSNSYYLDFNKDSAFFQKPFFKNPIFHYSEFGDLNSEFFHYSSEKLSLVIIAFLVFLISRIEADKKVSSLHLFIAGFLAGFSPFTKPQCGPIVLFISLYLVYLAYQLKPQSRPKNISLYLAGGLVFPLLMTVYVYMVDTWGVFNSQMKLIEGYKPTVIGPIGYVFGFIRTIAFTSLFLALLGLFMINYKKNLPANKAFFWFLVLLSLTTIFSISKPGRFYGHYFQYLLPLIFYFSIYALINKTYLINVAAVCLALITYTGLDRAHRRLNSAEAIKTGLRLPADTISQTINKFKKPHDKLAIWGFAPKYFVETQLPQATSQNHVPYIINSKYSRYFQEEYINEIKRNKPEFFIDVSTVEKFEEVIPSLKPYIIQNYELATVVDSNSVYIRKDRIASLK